MNPHDIKQLVIMVVYESKSTPGMWKGFCSPYAITTQADSCEEAKKNLEELVDLYEEGLKQYDYPIHLRTKELTDPEDKKAFEEITTEIKENIRAQMNNTFFKSPNRQVQGDIKTSDLFGSFYRRQFA